VTCFEKFLGLCFIVWWWFDVQTDSLDAVLYVTTSVPNLAICRPTTK
jgi:hypothetical protein